MERNDRKVFVAHYRGHDYEAAKEFGELFAITRGYIDYKKIDQLKYRVCKSLLQLNSSSDDYVILDGIYIVTTVVAVAWVEMHKKINILNYNMINNTYHPYTLTVSNIQEIFKQAQLELVEAVNGIKENEPQNR